MGEHVLLQRKRWYVAGEKMEISTASLSGFPLLRIVGDADHQSAPAFDEAVRNALSPDCGCLLLDLSDCPYLDSGGLGVIFGDEEEAATLVPAPRPDDYSGSSN